jgi:hypothetical protein
MPGKRKPSARRTLEREFRITTPNAPLDSSQVEDRRVRGTGGGSIPYPTRPNRRERRTLGMRPRSPRFVLPERDAARVEQEVNDAVVSGHGGASKLRYPDQVRKRKRLPWGLTNPEGK